MKFAFYGRVSTEDQQDPTSSKQWQMSRATAILPKDGAIVAEYSRHRPVSVPTVEASTGVPTAAGSAQAPEPWLRCRRHRRAGASVLRRPVRAHLPCVHSP